MSSWLSMYSCEPSSLSKKKVKFVGALPGTLMLPARQKDCWPSGNGRMYNSVCSVIVGSNIMCRLPCNRVQHGDVTGIQAFGWLLAFLDGKSTAQQCSDTASHTSIASAALDIEQKALSPPKKRMPK